LLEGEEREEKRKKKMDWWDEMKLVTYYLILSPLYLNYFFYIGLKRWLLSVLRIIHLIQELL